MCARVMCVRSSDMCVCVCVCASDVCLFKSVLVQFVN